MIASDHSLWSWGCNCCSQLGICDPQPNKPAPSPTRNFNRAVAKLYADPRNGKNADGSYKSHELVGRQRCPNVSEEETGALVGSSRLQISERLEAARTEEEEMMSKLRDMFTMADGDKSGGLGLSELGPALEALGIQMTPKELRRRMRECDKNSNSSLEFDEFVQMFQGDRASEAGAVWDYALPVQLEAVGPHWAELSCGDSHTVAVDDKGGVWAWGSNLAGQLGRGCVNSTCQWEAQPVEGLQGKFQQGPGGAKEGVAVGQVAAGHSSSAAVSRDGQQLFSWGDNSSGILGLAHQGLILEPSRVKNMPKTADEDLDNAIQVSLGTEHMVVVTQSRELWTCGSAAGGKLGHKDGNDRVALEHTEVMRPSGEVDYGVELCHVAAGQQHSVAATATGDLVLCGATTFGQLGLQEAFREVIVPTMHPEMGRWHIEAADGEAARQEVDLIRLLKDEHIQASTLNKIIFGLAKLRREDELDLVAVIEADSEVQKLQEEDRSISLHTDRISTLVWLQKYFEICPQHHELFRSTFGIDSEYLPEFNLHRSLSEESVY